MIIVYESKTGFTKKYADMLAAKTGLTAYPVSEFLKNNLDLDLTNEEVIFMGWMKIGKIQGLDKVRQFKLKAICGSGTGRTAEPDTETILTRNELGKIPFFYMQGGCLPLKDLKGMNRIVMSMFVNALKKRPDRDEKETESIAMIENGFDGVREDNLGPLLDFLNSSTN